MNRGIGHTCYQPIIKL